MQAHLAPAPAVRRNCAWEVSSTRVTCAWINAFSCKRKSAGRTSVDFSVNLLPPTSFGLHDCAHVARHGTALDYGIATTLICVCPGSTDMVQRTSGRAHTETRIQTDPFIFHQQQAYSQRPHPSVPCTLDQQKHAITTIWWSGPCVPVWLW